MKARELLTALGFCAPPYDPFDIAKKLDITVTDNAELDNLRNSGYIQNNGGRIKIWLNPLDGDARQRFTLAHELGHYIHDILPDIGRSETIKDTPTTLHRSGESDEKEYRANRFAANLLMPRSDIFEQAERLVEAAPNKEMYPEDLVAAMAETFCVSKPAMTVRLKSVGIL